MGTLDSASSLSVFSFGSPDVLGFWLFPFAAAIVVLASHHLLSIFHDHARFIDVPTNFHALRPSRPSQISNSHPLLVECVVY